MIQLKPDQVYISEVEIFHHVFNQLCKKGYAPTTKECWAIAEIVFDFLMNLAAIQDIEYDEIDDWEEE